MLQDSMCNLCKGEEESKNHLLIYCKVTKEIWKEILHWLEIVREHKGWTKEIVWALKYIKRKGWRANMLKLALTESLHEIWLYRNEIIF